MSTADAVPPATIEVPGEPPHLLIVRAPYYRAVVDGLTDGARDMLNKSGARHEILEVAGAYELAQGIRIALAGRTRFDGFMALGCVVRGETDHYDFICAAAMQGLMEVALRHAIALGVGLLTVDTIAQAQARAGADGPNKGAEAATACLLQVANLRRLGAPTHAT